MATSRDALLDDLRRRKKDRDPWEIEAVLTAFGWTCRDTTKEAGVWRCGTKTMTMPNTHGRPLLPVYVSRAVRLIEEAAAEQPPPAEKESEDA
jgi:hypothetical protein